MQRLILSVTLALLLMPMAYAKKNCSSCKNGEIKVMSYNMRHGKAKDGDNVWKNRCSATTAMLSDVSPDIFGVQECLPFQAEFILENSPEYDGYGIGRNDGVNGERTEIFWKKKCFELLDKGTFWLSETPETPSKGWDGAHARTATWVLLKQKAGGRKILFVNTHLDHKGKLAQKNGLQQIREWIEKKSGEKLPVVLTGDFNIHDDNPIIIDFNKALRNARLNSSSKIRDVSSFHGWGKVSGRCVIDYIYFDNFKACKSFDTIDKSYNNIPYISDHYPIVSVLKF